MHKFKVGDKFVVVHSNSNNSELDEGRIHTIEELYITTVDQLFPYYLSDSGWYLEDTYVDNRVIISGSDQVFAVLNKIEEPDT